MDKQIFDALEEMLKFLDFDPDQKIFRLFSNDLVSHYKLKNLVEYTNDVDPSGSTTLIYLSKQCYDVLKNTSVNVLSVINDPSVLSKFVAIKNLLDSEIVSKTKSRMLEMINHFATSCGNVTLIGEQNLNDVESEFVNSIESVINEFGKLKFEVYTNSGHQNGKIEQFSPDIQVFGSLSQCLLTLEKCSDGICVCYISNGGLDGYFGFFVKSNGNLFSLNERIDEVYVGQHARCRNGRYAEDHAFDLFPYDEICKFSGEDYKGYSTNIEINKDCLNIFELGKTNRSVYMRMIISMALIINKYSNFKIEKEPVFIDALIPRNLKQLENSSENALIKFESSSLVKQHQTQFSIHFDKEKLLNGDYNIEFDWRSNKSRKRGESGVFPGYNQKWVKAYGKDFEFSDDELLNTNSSRRLIGDSNTSFEFIGNKKRMELQAYYNLRKKLASHIKNKMDEDLTNFGGIHYLVEWYREKLLEHKDEIYRLCVECYDHHDDRNEFRFGKNPEDSDSSIDLRPHVKMFDEKYHIFHGIGPIYNWKMILTPYEFFATVNNIKHLICPITNFKANRFFLFKFVDCKQVEDFIGSELPTFCKEWRNITFYDRHYNGNSILDVTDAVGFIDSPLTKDSNGRRVDFSFSFALGFSKDGLNRLKKEYKK